MQLLINEKENRQASKKLVDSWYTGRDSNPQPSEPESDALSIEPPVHLLYSLVIITRFLEFVKTEIKKLSPFFRLLYALSPT